MARRGCASPTRSPPRSGTRCSATRFAAAFGRPSRSRPAFFRRAICWCESFLPPANARGAISPVPSPKCRPDSSRRRCRLDRPHDRNTGACRRPRESVSVGPSPHIRRTRVSARFRRSAIAVSIPSDLFGLCPRRIGRAWGAPRILADDPEDWAVSAGWRVRI